MATKNLVTNFIEDLNAFREEGARLEVELDKLSRNIEKLADSVGKLKKSTEDVLRKASQETKEISQ